MRTDRHNSTAVVGKFGAAAGIVGALTLVWIVPGQLMDFGYAWLAAKAVVAGTDPYVPMSQLANAAGVTTELNIQVPWVPGALLLQAPLAAIPWPFVYFAGRILVVVSAAALAGACAKHAQLRSEPFLLALPIVMLLWPFAGAMAVGNTGVFVAALIAWTWFVTSDRPTAGIPLGVAFTLKLWPWLLIPALFISGRRRTALGAALTFVVLNVGGLALPHISLDGFVAGVKEAALVHGPRSFAVFPVWAGLAIGTIFLTLMWKRSWHPRWAIPVALAVAPLIWASYSPVLLVPVADWMRSSLPGRRIWRHGSPSNSHRQAS